MKLLKAGLIEGKEYEKIMNPLKMTKQNNLRDFKNKVFYFFKIKNFKKIFIKNYSFERFFIIFQFLFCSFIILI